VLSIVLIFLLPELILYALFSHEFSASFFFIHIVAYAVFMCVVYIFYFSFFLYLTMNKADKVDYFCAALGRFRNNCTCTVKV